MEPAAKRAKLAIPAKRSDTKLELGTEMITVQVGPKRKEFEIHANLVPDSTNHFFDILSDSDPWFFSIEEDYVEAFSLFIQWLYEGTILNKNHTSTTQHLHDLYDLYFLAEKTGLIKLQNDTMDAIQDFARRNNLRQELISKMILRRVVTSTSGQGQRVGLRYFAATMMSWYSIVKAAAVLKLNKAEGQPITDFEAVSEPLHIGDNVEISDEAAELALEMGKMDASFFKDFMAIHQYNLQMYAQGPEIFEEEDDPRREREVNDPVDWCWFHNHSDGSSCKPPELNEEESSTVAETAVVTEKSSLCRGGESRVKAENGRRY